MYKITRDSQVNRTAILRSHYHRTRVILSNILFQQFIHFRLSRYHLNPPRDSAPIGPMAQQQQIQIHQTFPLEHLYQPNKYLDTSPSPSQQSSPQENDEELRLLLLRIIAHREGCRDRKCRRREMREERRMRRRSKETAPRSY